MYLVNIVEDAVLVIMYIVMAPFKMSFICYGKIHD
jgi:hypothetical protein